jgi:flotillin
MMANVVMVGAVSVLVALVVLAFIISRIIYICPPNEVLIFSGGHRKMATGEERVLGYRVVQGGRGIRIPLIEVVDRMDLTNMPIDLKVQGAYSRGGIPLNVQGVANVKVSSKSDHLANAV